MKTLFENTTIYSKKIYLEAQGKWYQKNALKKRWFYLLMAAFCFVCAYYYLSRASWPAGVIFIVMGILLVLVYFHGYRFSAERAYNEQKDIFPANGFKWTITKDKMVWKTAEAERPVFYKQIEKIYETGHTFVLVAGGKMHILDKDGFTAGSAADFKSFLMKKCPQAFK